MKTLRWVILVILAATLWWGYLLVREHNLSWADLLNWTTDPAPIGVLDADPLARLGLPEQDVAPPAEDSAIRFLGVTKYLNDAKAVVTHTVDDTQPDVPKVLETLDRYGVKATFFISTRRGPIGDLWPLLARAVRDGHEIGSHSRTHPCQFPPDVMFCFLKYGEYELAGSRDDILAHVDQPYVWSFAYPCGLCFNHEFVRRNLQHAGYLVARGYPEEGTGGHLAPDLQTWASERYHASYTQVVQKKGGPVALDGRTSVPEVNGKFDEVYENGGIYHFVTHPQWLDFEPGSFYEQHLGHIAGREDCWYVPLGPLYAYQDARDRTKVYALGQGRFTVAHDLSQSVYLNSVTMEFVVPESGSITVTRDGKDVPRRPPGPTVGWDEEYYRRSGSRLLVTVCPNSVVQVGVD